MAFTNTKDTYSPITKFFHWLLFILVTVMLIIGANLGNIPKAYKRTVIDFHKSLGLTILALMILWIIWAIFNRKPQYPHTMKLWEKILAKTVQKLLYICVLLMPLIGWLMSSAAGKYPVYFGWFTMKLPIIQSKPLAKFFSELHTIFAWIILGLVCLHIIGALKHHFIDKNNILMRMLP